MRIFSKKKENTVPANAGISTGISEWNKQEENKIPRILPNTLMQNISIAQNKNQDATSPRMYTDDIKANLKLKAPSIPAIDEHKKIPQDIHESRDKGLDKREVEKVLMLKEIQVPQPPLVPFPTVAVSAPKPEEHHHHSFFAELERLFGQKHDVRHIVSQDMMSKLKEYHDAKGKGEAFFMHEIDIEKEIEKSLSSLKDIESEWLLTKKGVASAERLLFEKEEELERRLGEFRTLLTSADKFKKFNTLAPDGNAFILSGGVKLYSLQHLINELPKMDDSVFFAHVTGDKNDFSAWIHNVFKFEDLALRISQAKNRQDILEIMKNY